MCHFLLCLPKCGSIQPKSTPKLNPERRNLPAGPVGIQSRPNLIKISYMKIINVYNLLVMYFYVLTNFPALPPPQKYVYVYVCINI